MRLNVGVVVAVVFWCSIKGAGPVSAQQVSSFEQLQLMVKPGDRIEVIGTDGVSTKGKIENLTPASLRLKVKGTVRDFAQRDAIEIKQRRPDSLANGAWIGAVSGGGLVGLAAIATCASLGCHGDGPEFAAAAVAYTGIGAAIGVGIDAMITHRQTIYRQSAQTTLESVRVAPLIASGRKGVALSFTF